MLYYTKKRVKNPLKWGNGVEKKLRGTDGKTDEVIK
jgi:hypothetical protein